MLLGAGVAGCETGGSILGDPFASNDTLQRKQPWLRRRVAAKIALAPVIGAPDPVSKQLVTQLTCAVEKHRITLAPDRDAKADYLLRGYIVAARDKTNDQGVLHLGRQRPDRQARQPRHRRGGVGNSQPERPLGVRDATGDPDHRRQDSILAGIVVA